VLTSLALLLSWGLLAASGSWIAIQQWHYLRERKNFEASLQKAQSLADRYNPAINDIQSQQWWQEQTQQVPQEATKSAPQNGTKAASTLYLRADSPMTRQETQPLPEPGKIPTNGRYLREHATHSAVVTAEPATRECLQMVIGTATDPGIKRKHKPNEDRLLAIQGTLACNTQPYPFGLFVVADGMGGHANGQEASSMAIQSIREAVMPTLLSNFEIQDEYSAEFLVDAVQQANLALYVHNQAYQTDMGTTITTAVIAGKTISIANVGDSRTYRYAEDGGLASITRDHSVVARLVERGDITPDEVYTHPKRNEIYRCLGESASIQVDTFTLPLEAGITLLLCSDGLWEMVRDPDIEEILRTTLPNTQEASQALIHAALDGGGKDNVSVVVVHIM
jgi:serine/threonine protein phosphatase PrpC